MMKGKTVACSSLQSSIMFIWSKLTFMFVLTPKNLHLNLFSFIQAPEGSSNALASSRQLNH